MADHRRFFVPPEQITEGRAVVRGDAARQISRVLRLEPGDPIILLDGTRQEHLCEIVSLSKDEITATIKSSRYGSKEPETYVALAVCLPKADGMDEIVQKATELGISEYIVLNSERVVSRPSADKLRARMNRWQRIAAESAEQSGRAVQPKLGGPVDITDLASRIGEFKLALVAWEEERHTSLRKVLREGSQAGSVLVVIGPEGGLTSREVGALVEAGAVSVSLGRSLLRVATAAIATSAIVMHELEPDICSLHPDAESAAAE